MKRIRYLVPNGMNGIQLSHSQHLILQGLDKDYSVRKLFAGLAIAARIVCTLKVANATAIIPSPLTTNIHQLMTVRKA
jgi:hypothetical protein